MNQYPVCKNPLCGGPIERGTQCPYCSTPYGRAAYPFEAFLKRVVVLGTATAVGLVFLGFVTISLFSSIRRDLDVATTATTSIQRTETAPLPTWTERLQRGISAAPPQIMPTSDQTLDTTKGLWLIATQGERRPTLKVIESGNGLISLSENDTRNAFVWRLSPDGNWLAHNGDGTSARELWLRELHSQKIVTTNFQRNVNDFAWSSDSRYLLVNFTQSSSNTLKVFALDDLRQKPTDQLIDAVPTLKQGVIGPVDWSKDGHIAYIYVVGNKLRLSINEYAVDTRSNRLTGEIDLPNLDSQRYQARALRWSPDSNNLAFAIFDSGANGETRVYVLQSTQKTGLVLVKTNPVRSNSAPVWLDSTHLLIIEIPGQPIILDLDQKQMLRITNIGTNLELLDHPQN